MNVPISVDLPRLEEVSRTYAGGTPDRDHPEYFGGSIPWVKSGEVVGLVTQTDETLTEEGLNNSSAKWIEPGALLIAMYGAGLTAGQVARLGIRATTNQAVLAIVPNEPNEAEYLGYALAAAVPSLLRRKQGSGQPNLNAEIVRRARVPWPSDGTRRAVERVMRCLDSGRLCITQLLEAKRTFMRGLMQQLLSGQKRFPEFRGRSWELHRFDHLCEEVADRNGKLLGADSVMGVIKGLGFEPMRERVRGKGDLARYKVVPPYAFAYNPMRLNIGSIAHNTLERHILVSPDYEVFRVREGKAEADFIDQLRSSWYWSSFMKRAGAGSVRVRIYFKDLAHLRVPMPEIDEQSRIAEVLRLAELELDLIAAQRDQIDAYKRALLSRLLSGELKVPE